MEIAVCRPEDVEVLERLMPSTSADGRHAARFARQEAGESGYVVPVWMAVGLVFYFLYGHRRSRLATPES